MSNTMKLDFNDMPPQIRMMYEKMLLPKLREFDTDELEALREFFNAEIDKLKAEKGNPVIEGEAVELSPEENQRLLQEAIAQQQALGADSA